MRTPPHTGDDAVFRYVARKDDCVDIYYHDRCVTTLKGRDAVRFLNNAESADASALQRLMARATGNFKRGNERVGKRRRDS